MNNNWETFKEINTNRRSIRDFDGNTIIDEEIKEILAQASLAPSSGNSQPYQFHWVKNTGLKHKVAQACNGQRAAATASTILVLVASTGAAKTSIKKHKLHVIQSKDLSDKSKNYNMKTIDTMAKFLKFGSLIIWTPLLNLFSLIKPITSLIPFGGIGIRNWAAKNSIFAAQNLMLAAADKGYDTCPMEGFNPLKIASLLKLPYGSVIPVIIALGKRKTNAHLEPQWRKSFEDMVVIH